MIIFNYLLTLKKSRLWKSRQEKINDLDSHDLDDLLKNLKTITNYIYILCEEMYILALENKKYKSNFYDVAPIFNVKTAKSLYDLNSK